MRKMLSALLAMLLLAVFAGTAQAENVHKEDMICAAAEADFPGWRLAGSYTYGAGSWENEMAWNCSVLMMQLDQEQLRFMRLEAVMNPLRPGDPVPWEITTYAPVPLTAEAAARIAAVSPERFNTYYSLVIPQDMLPGCAEFLLQGEERLTELLVYRDFLVGVVQDAQRQERLCIAHWDGEKYARITASAPCSSLSINDIHSGNGALEVFAGQDLEVWLECGSDGVWRLGMVTDEDRYFLTDGALFDTAGEFVTWNNLFYTYGEPTFPVLVEGMDFDDLPRTTAEAAARMDAAGYACVRVDGAPMFDAPEGEAVASCHARLTGRVTAETADLVQLQCGNADTGLTGWFRREDLAFGSDIHAVGCGFPTWVYEHMHAEAVDEAIAAVIGSERLWYELWLVGRTAEGDWLALVEGGNLCRLPAAIVGEAAPPLRDLDEWEAWWESTEADE